LASGSVALTWAGFQPETFEISEGSPRRRQSSKGVWRRLCGDCGTPITFESERFPGEVHITVGSLDRPGDMPPQVHVFTEERIAWLHLDDDLPKHAKTSGQS
jgi:hypothetical protein